MSMSECVINYINGHIEVYSKYDNSFIQSADNIEELENDLKEG